MDHNSQDSHKMIVEADNHPLDVPAVQKLLVEYAELYFKALELGGSIAAATAKFDQILELFEYPKFGISEGVNPDRYTIMIHVEGIEDITASYPKID